MYKQFVLTAFTTAMAMAMLCCSDVLAQERPGEARLLLEPRKLGERSPHESGRRDTGGMTSALKEHHISVQRVDAFTYLQERRGKVPVYSALDKKLSLELGVFGYLGVKWRF
jgi:hypothetical protein